MSRIGKKEIALPKGVTVSVKDGMVTVANGKKEISKPLVMLTNIVVDGDVAKVTRVEDDGLRIKEGQRRAYHGLMRALLQNMVTGVTTGFTKTLELHGIGYKAEVKGKELVLNLGYSHPINVLPPADIKVEIVKGRKVPTVAISGMDKEVVGQIASEIRGYRPPNAYLGKGVRYEGEVIRLKSGKS
jgi:large subunit ribosomal protein L6